MSARTLVRLGGVPPVGRTHLCQPVMGRAELVMERQDSVFGYVSVGFGSVIRRDRRNPATAAQLLRH